MLVSCLTVFSSSTWSCRVSDLLFSRSISLLKLSNWSSIIPQCIRISSSFSASHFFSSTAFWTWVGLKHAVCAIIARKLEQACRYHIIKCNMYHFEDFYMQPNFTILCCFPFLFLIFLISITSFSSCCIIKIIVIPWEYDWKLSFVATGVQYTSLSL